MARGAQNIELAPGAMQVSYGSGRDHRGLTHFCLVLFLRHIYSLIFFLTRVKRS